MAQHAARHATAETRRYERHSPEDTVLHRSIRDHWPEFLERAEEAGGLPRFVVREVEEYLRCGLLEHGCVRVGCCRCGFERLVAFSCKRRGFCPEGVIPEVPVRQWVCSLPCCAEVLEAFLVELSRSLKRRAKEVLGLDSVDQALTGAVSVIQRGDSALRVNVHFHVLALDGVYVRDAEGGALVFHALGAPTTEELAEVARRTARRIQKVLARHGRTLDGTGEGDVAAPADEQLALSALCAAAAGRTTLSDDRAGQPLLRVVDPAPARKTERSSEALGVNVHADVAVPARDRAQLERLARYLCRPPIAQERLEETAGGKLRHTLKRPWRDGTIAIVLEPMDLLARVCALIPPPRFHMVRYHGVLSSHAKARAEIVPHAPEPTAKQLSLLEGDASIVAPEPRRKPWAWLLRHVFEIDVTTCPRCGGATRWLEAATTPDAIARLLAKHGLGPRRRRAAVRPVSSASCSRRRSSRPL